MYNLYQIPPEDVNDYWNRFSVILKKAVAEDHDEHADKLMDDYKKNIEAGICSLWVILNKETLCIDAVAITKIFYHLDTKIFSFCLVSGEDVHKWTSVMNEFFKIAKIEQCKFITFSGRRGWKKYLEDYCFKEKETLFRAEV